MYIYIYIYIYYIYIYKGTDVHTALLLQCSLHKIYLAEIKMGNEEFDMVLFSFLKFQKKVDKT